MWLWLKTGQGPSLHQVDTSYWNHFTSALFTGTVNTMKRSWSSGLTLAPRGRSPVKISRGWPLPSPMKVLDLWMISLPWLLMGVLRSRVLVRLVMPLTDWSLRGIAISRQLAKIQCTLMQNICKTFQFSVHNTHDVMVFPQLILGKGQSGYVLEECLEEQKYLVFYCWQDQPANERGYLMPQAPRQMSAVAAIPKHRCMHNIPWLASSYIFRGWWTSCSPSSMRSRHSMRSSLS